MRKAQPNTIPLPLSPLVVCNAAVMRLTVDQYQRMMETGILVEGAPYELIQGIIVRKDRSAVGEDRSTVGCEHVWCVQKLGRLDKKLERLGCHMQLQSPVIMSNLDEPEPDGVILRGTIDDYKLRKPAAKDASCVMEVADGSLLYDRTDKLSLYANSNIPQYVIINLPDRLIEIYTEPRVLKGRYCRTQSFRTADKIRFGISGNRTIEMTARSLLP